MLTLDLRRWHKGMINKKTKSDSSWTSVTILTGLVVILLSTTVLSGKSANFPRDHVSFSLSPLPLKVDDSNFTPELSAVSAIVVDTKSGVVVFEKAPDLIVPPASTTKMITALVALESMNLSDVVEVSSVDVEPQIMKLVRGERITLENLLFGVLVWSANDAAEVVAQSLPGGRTEFISLMNKRAKEMGMLNTNFVNPSGLPDPEHFSTARDLARFATHAMQNSSFAGFVATPEVTVSSYDGRIVHKLVNLNELLGKVPGVLGVKTGWLDDTGGALVSYVNRDGRTIVVVVLDSWDRFGDSERLIEWAYANYSWKDPQLTVE